MVELVFLGTAQDGGIPHFNCTCTTCQSHTRLVASIAIIGEKTIIIDATPDFSTQSRLITSFDGIILTHLHIGHYVGLLQLGREVANLTDFPVYMTKEIYQFFRDNKPFSYLLHRKQIHPIIISPETPVSISPDYTIIPFEVPHRNEDGNTIGITIKTQTSSTIYIPDIDYLDQSTQQRLNLADTIIFDGTFYSSQELPRQQNIPHPPILDTISTLGSQDLSTKFLFTHFNHSNPVLLDLEKQNHVISQGYLLASDNLRINI